MRPVLMMQNKMKMNAMQLWNRNKVAASGIRLRGMISEENVMCTDVKIVYSK